MILSYAMEVSSTCAKVYSSGAFHSFFCVPLSESSCRLPDRPCLDRTGKAFLFSYTESEIRAKSERTLGMTVFPVRGSHGRESNMKIVSRNTENGKSNLL